ncbi:MAG: 1-(5-phosphoribosyl)-5-((5-phosphoribosylamino)methylideneamino) imidazole-4-carboxamide isomerase [Methanoregula sp. PtaU1.Bin051]|nr:MAG: 1-(5-phosphoribosyl)-5-((5-phosphoribosylamino)methylideneamino) imidazole-4-carboxamide isomerase [Methanoregula sp. PtaU1.Bin051]
MDLVLAVDLRKGKVVHGKSGNREQYLPLDWAHPQSTEPVRFVSALRPKFLYIADLDRIEGTGSHDTAIRSCAKLVKQCYVDRGIRTPIDYLTGKNIINVIGTETCGDDLNRYRGGVLSIDIRHGKVIPSGKRPVEVLVEADRLGFEGCIVLSLESVGTSRGIDPAATLQAMRSAYTGTLLYGGGVASPEDLQQLADAGFDGAIVATAVHRGSIPLSWVQEGCMC